MPKRSVTLKVGSIILAAGFKSFDPARLDNYAYTRLTDVVTSMEFERILSATGPYAGHLVRPSSMAAKNAEGKQPRKIAWLQCIGSRDLNRGDNGYCSSVCCMYAVKQAVMAKEHCDTPVDCAIFYIDIRTQGKDFDRYFENAHENGVRFIPARVHTIESMQDGDDLLLRYADEGGQPHAESFDMVVLSTGLEVSPETVELAGTLGIALDRYHFTRRDSFNSVATSVPGIYACGVFTGPKDIPQSVIEASAAACAATENLAAARNTQTRKVEIPAQRDVARQAPRIGVFVCNCGINIGGVVRVPEVAAFVNALPGVVYVEENLFTCSQDTQDKITAVIREKNLNRVVVAACTPRTHEALFQETLVNAGLNKYLLEMANIRNHDSWVHAFNPDAATEKAKDLVRMAVAKAALLEPLHQTELPVNQPALVVGAGIAGMTAALSLSRQGFEVHLVEKSGQLGGNARNLHKTYKDEDIGSFLDDLIRQVKAEPLISVHRNTTVGNVEGFVGNFKSVLSKGPETQTVVHGAAILATGAREYTPQEYLYGDHAAVITHLEMDGLLRKNDARLLQGCQRRLHPVCRVPRHGTSLLFQSVLHPFHKKRSGVEKSKPGDKRLYSLPGYQNIRRKRRPVPGSPSSGNSFFSLPPGQKTPGRCKRQWSDRPLLRRHL